MSLWDRTKRLARSVTAPMKERIWPSQATIDEKVKSQFDAVLASDKLGDEIRPLLENIINFRSSAIAGDVTAIETFNEAMNSLRNDFGTQVEFSPRGKVTVCAVDGSTGRISLVDAAASGKLNGTPLCGIEPEGPKGTGKESEEAKPGNEPKVTARSSTFVKRNWGKYTDYYRGHKTGGLVFSAAKVGIGAALVWNGAKKLLNRTDGSEMDMEMEEGGVSKPTAAGKLYAAVQTLVGAGLVVLGGYTGKLAWQGRSNTVRSI